MKISVFAKKNNVTVDTIRHYIDIKLLLPLKDGGQYNFDQQAQRDLDEITKLKALRFSLKEIQTIIDYKRLSNLPATAYKNHLLDCYSHQLAHLKEEKEALQDGIDSLEELLLHTKKIENKQETLGVHLNLIPYLLCPNCQSASLNLESNCIKNNMIIEGRLVCTCGNSLSIQDGILLGKGHFDSNYHEEFVLSDYIKGTDPQLISNIRKGMNWFHKNIKEDTFKDKVLLDLGSGSGFFVRGAIERIQSSKCYLAIDHDMGRHRHLKKILETSGITIPIQFICCDFNSIPLKLDCIDIIIDSSGTSNYGFDHDTFLLDLVQPLVKRDSMLIGTYIIFEKFSINHPLPLNHRHLFDKEQILTNIEANHYHIYASDQGACYNEESPQEDYFSKDDLVSNIWLCAQKRWG